MVYGNVCHILKYCAVSPHQGIDLVSSFLVKHTIKRLDYVLIFVINLKLIYTPNINLTG